MPQTRTKSLAEDIAEIKVASVQPTDTDSKKRSEKGRTFNWVRIFSDVPINKPRYTYGTDGSVTGKTDVPRGSVIWIPSDVAVEFNISTIEDDPDNETWNGLLGHRSGKVAVCKIPKGPNYPRGGSVNIHVPSQARVPEVAKILKDVFKSTTEGIKPKSFKVAGGRSYPI